MMTDAPERIWAYWDDEYEVITGSLTEKPHEPTVEYIRADLSLPLGAVAMRDVASAIVAGMAPFYKGETRFAEHASLTKQIANIPLPDHAALLAAALKLPEVAAMRGALRDIIDTGGAFGTAAHFVRIDAIARTALADLEGKNMSDQFDMDAVASDFAEQIVLLNRECNALAAALDAAEAEKARAVEAERERCAALIDCGGCVDLPCCSPADCNVMIAAAIRTGAKP